MYTVKIKRSFSAAHFLKEYKGNCEKLHGHNWVVYVAISKEELDSQGMVMDFKKLKKQTDQIIKQLDHTCLNDFDYFKNKNTTSENIATFIYEQLISKLKDLNLKKITVTVNETEDSQAIYTEDL
jgi:6-pyruvoyltetrahydropterin/6-carboxytetrahydropterin synthase